MFRHFILMLILAVMVVHVASARAEECESEGIIIDRGNSVHGLKGGVLFAYVDLANMVDELSCHSDTDIQASVTQAVTDVVATWWKEPRLASAKKAEVHIISILNKDEYAQADFNAARMHGKLEFTNENGVIKLQPAKLDFSNFRTDDKKRDKEGKKDENAPTTDQNAGLNFTLASTPQQCSKVHDGVLGVTSPLPDEDNSEIQVSRARRAWDADQSQKATYEATMKFTIAPSPELESMRIEDISLTLPEDFHANSEYELSCRAADGKFIVFRKFSPKLHNQNFDEAPQSLLPRDCLGHSGEVQVRGASLNDAAVKAELELSVFRAVFWDQKIATPDPAALDLYLPKMGYQAGERIPVHAQAADSSKAVTLEIVRIGKGDNKTIATIGNLNLSSQNISPYSFRDGLNWPVAAEIVVPANAPSGYYMAVLKQSGETDAQFPFVVKPKAGDKTAIAVIAAVNTWRAYNRWDHGSFYNNDIGKACLNTDYGRLITTQRPIEAADMLKNPARDEHLFRAEKEIGEWLEKNNIAYVMYTDDDLNADPALLNDHAIVLIPSHSEYYTTAMYDNLENFSKKGGNILYLGGNGINYRIGMRGTQLEKDESGKRLNIAEGFAGMWHAHHNRSQAKLLGVEYDARDYDTYAPYEIKKADHPVFAGTGLKNGDTIGEDGSGREMDIITESSPTNVVLLAKGTNPKGYGGDMVMFDAPGGGKVFSVGSIAFFNALKDDKMSMVLKNVIKMMLEPKAKP